MIDLNDMTQPVARLNRMADFLEKEILPSVWGGLSGFDIVEWSETGKQPEIGCETSACVLGWAALDPVLNEKGLVWRGSRPFFIFSDRKYLPSELLNNYKYASAEFFGIDDDDADNLFYDFADVPDGPEGLKQQIALIRSIVARKVSQE